MKKTIATISLAALSILSVQAASISSAGTIVGLTPPGNGVGTDVADLDAAGAGTDGFVLFNSIAEGGNQGGVPWAQAIVDSSPAYITNLDGLASTSSGGWANYDDVLVGGTQYNTGGIQAAGIGAGVEAALFTFELSGSVPSALKVGLIVDSSDNTIWSASNIRIEGPGAITANQNVLVDGATDLVQFNIDNGVPGEVYTIHATQPPGAGGAILAGITFDSIPEPSTALLGLIGGLALLRRKR